MIKLSCKNKMKYVVPVCAAVLLISGTALANGANRKALLASHGAVDFSSAEGSILIDSTDLTNLADEIDSLESAFKSKTKKALNGINTYVKNDGTVSYDPGSAANQPELPTYNQLMDGIANSQSSSIGIARLSGTSYYRTSKGKLTTSSSGNTSVSLGSAIDDNLSAGKVAYADGTLLLGTGYDNAVLYKNGYNKGYAEGYAASEGCSNISYTYHSHSSSCYTNGKLTCGKDENTIVSATIS